MIGERETFKNSDYDEKDDKSTSSLAKAPKSILTFERQ